MAQSRSEKILSAAAKFPEHAEMALAAVRSGESFSDFSARLLRALAVEHGNPMRASATPRCDDEALGDWLGLRLLGDLPLPRGEEKTRRIRAAELAGSRVNEGRHGLLRGIAEVSSPAGAADITYRAFSSGSDFPRVTQQAFSVLLEAAYQAEAKPWEAFTRIIPADDFRVGHVVRGDMPSLVATGELVPLPTPAGAEQDASFALVTYGAAYDIGRRLLLDDSAGALQAAATGIAAASARTVANLIFALIQANGAMTDGLAVFHATHANTGTAAQDAAGLATTMARIRNQLSLSGESMNLIPTHILVAPAAEGVFRGLLGAYPQPGDLTLLVDRRLSPSTTYFCIAAGSPGLGIAALNGSLQPSIQRAIPMFMGTRFLIAMDLAPLFLDFRSWSRSTA